jgi:hypothetical protein
MEKFKINDKVYIEAGNEIVGFTQIANYKIPDNEEWEFSNVDFRLETDKFLIIFNELIRNKK